MDLRGMGAEDPDNHIQAVAAEALTRSLQAAAGYATVAMWRIRSMHLQL